MIPIFLQFTGICLIISLIAIFLYSIPVSVRIALEWTSESRNVLAQACWGCLGVGVTGDLNEYRWNFLIWGHPLLTKIVTEKKVQSLEVRDIISKILPMLKFIRPIRYLVKRFLKRVTLEEIKGTITIGFENPAETGIFFGWYYAIRPIFNIFGVRLELVPIFNKEIIEGNLTTKIRIDRPLVLFISAVVLFLNRDVRVSLSNHREG